MAAVDTQKKSVRAQAKYVHSSARKARLVTDLIRGRSVPEARTILAFSKRAVAEDVEKVLRSAVANAESRPDLHWNGDDLVVATAYVDEGPTLKRFRPRARGRASAIRKRMCHITVELAPNPQRAGVREARRRGEGAAEARAEGRRDRDDRRDCSGDRGHRDRTRRGADDRGSLRGEAEGCSPEEEDRGE